MRIDTIMTRNVETISSNATLEEAARIMDIRAVGILPVLENERLVGVVTDRDIAIRGIGRGLNPRRTAVRNLMSSPALICMPDETVVAACALMERNLVRRLIVVDADDAIIGLVSLDDVAARARYERLSGHVLAGVAAA
jgi:CBS domain-containing protein